MPLVIHNDIKTADGEFEIFQNLTTADIQRVARTYFTPANRLVLTLLPSGRQVGDEPQAGRVERDIARESRVSVSLWHRRWCLSVAPRLCSAQAPARPGRPSGRRGRWRRAT